jgi:hypothetical protein
MLRRHGEDDLAEGVASITDDELTRIRTLGAYYAFSEDALALHGSMGGAAMAAKREPPSRRGLSNRIIRPC